MKELKTATVLTGLTGIIVAVSILTMIVVGTGTPPTELKEIGVSGAFGLVTAAEVAGAASETGQTVV